MANTTTWVARHSMIQNGWQASVNKGVGTKAKDVLHTHTSKVHNILTIARRDICPFITQEPGSELVFGSHVTRLLSQLAMQLEDSLAS